MKVDVYFRSHLMQADSDTDCQAWVTAIQSSVKLAYSQDINTPQLAVNVSTC